MSVQHFSSTSALIRYGSEDYGEGYMMVNVENGKLKISDTTVVQPCTRDKNVEVYHKEERVKRSYVMSMVPIVRVGTILYYEN